MNELQKATQKATDTEDRFGIIDARIRAGMDTDFSMLKTKNEAESAMKKAADEKARKEAEI